MCCSHFTCLSLSSSAVFPLFLLTQLIFPSLTFIPLPSSALAASSLVCQPLHCAVPVGTVSLCPLSLVPVCAHVHAYTLAVTFEFLSAFLRCDLERPGETIYFLLPHSSSLT